MSDFLELSKRRQSCRSFLPQPVEHEKLLQCVEAARLTPSACNAQPWSFVVVETPQAVAAVAKCAQQTEASAFVLQAQAFFVVLEEHARLLPFLRRLIESQYFAKGDLGAATFCLTLAAESLGLGTCIIGIYDREGICKALDIPVEKKIGAVIAVGYPADPKVREKVRKPLENIVRFV